jgi:hypothetical protein
MATYSLYRDYEGDAWLKGVEGPGTTVEYLGPPSMALYNNLVDLVPRDQLRDVQELMLAFIGDRLDAIKFGLACAAEDEATYRRQKI